MALRGRSDGLSFYRKEEEMPHTVKSITLWRKEVENQPGTLAATLEPLAKGGADLQVVMGYRFPGSERMAAIEVYPVAGRTAAKEAQAAELEKSSIPTLLVEGDNRSGLGHAIAHSLNEAGINMAFLMAQVIGRRYSAVVGFESAEDAKKAATLIKRAAGAQKPRAAARKKRLPASR
jgi:hypothetical protein